MMSKNFLTQVLNSTLPISLISFLALGCAATAQPGSDSGSQQNSSVHYCTLPDLELPEEFVVYRGGGNSQQLPYPIDDSHSVANEIDVIVNSPSQPVVLLLGGNDPNVWDIQWTEDTDIVGVVAYGSHRQGIAGLPNDTPVLINTSERCGKDYFQTSLGDDFTLEQLSEYLFGQSLEPNLSAEQSPIAYRTEDFVVGEPLEKDSVFVPSDDTTVLVSYDDTTVESFLDRTAPRVNRLGIEDAIERGVLRRATMKDVEAWVEAHLKYKEFSSPGSVFSSAEERESYKAKLIDSLEPRPYLNINDSYVVLGDFTYPAGLYANAPTFFVPKGAPKPSGYSGHSSVHDSSGKCLSTECQSLIRNIAGEM